MLINDLLLSDFSDVVYEPYEHIYDTNVLNIDILDELLNNFPKSDALGWFGHESIKMFMGGNSNYWPPIGKEVFGILESNEFCSILENKFNTPILYPTTIAGGYQNGFTKSNLDMHIDIQRINGRYRWINLHIYLNKNWNKMHGGELILWNKQTGKKIFIPPKFGTIIVYKSGVNSYHGHPSIWLGPQGRMGISVYYFADIPMDDWDPTKEIIPELTNEQFTILTSKSENREIDLNILKNLKYK